MGGAAAPRVDPAAVPRDPASHRGESGAAGEGRARKAPPPPEREKAGGRGGGGGRRGGRGAPPTAPVVREEGGRRRSLAQHRGRRPAQLPNCCSEEREECAVAGGRERGWVDKKICLMGPTLVS